MIFSKRTQAWLLVLLCAGPWLGSPCVTAQTEFKIATISPDGSAWMRGLRRSISLIEAQTEGRVTFRVYPGGVMGDDRSVLRKMRAQQLHGGIFQTGAFERASSSIQLYNLPMYFQDFDEVSAVREKLDPLLLEELRSIGYEAFGLVGLGFAHAMSSNPGTSIEDARRLKVWAPKGDAGSIRLLDAFGIVPVPLSLVDVLAGLQTGLIDTVASPPTAAIALQWHTQLDYILDLPFMYVYSVFLVDGQRFARLSSKDQEVTRNALGSLLARIEIKNYQDHATAIAALEKQGLTRLTPTDAERSEWQRVAAAAIQRWIASDILRADYAELLNASVVEYRSGLAR